MLADPVQAVYPESSRSGHKGWRMPPRAGSIILASLTALAWPSRALPQGSGAETALLAGRVLDEGQRPIAGVEVVLNRQVVRAVTSDNGSFSLLLTSLDSTVAFRRVGYAPLLLTLDPRPRADDTVLVYMRRSPVRLPDVIALAAPSKPFRYAGTTKYDDVFRRQRLGLGTLLPREAIELRVGGSTARLLEGIAGVHYFHGLQKRLSFARCREPGGVAVFIDGFRQIPARASYDESPEIEMLSRVHPSSIEMIEVFRGVSQLPGEFHWNGCAVVAIWTRWSK